MVTSTRQARKQEFEYLIKEILDADDDEVLKAILAQNKLTMIFQVLTLSTKAIELLTFTDAADNVEKPIPLYIASTFQIIKAWNQYLIAQHNIIKVDWSDKSVVNADAYDEFRVSAYDPDAPLSSYKSTVPSPAPTPVRSAPSTHQSSALAEFRKGMKRDKTHYTELRDEKQWDDWKRKTVATVYAHGCENVISPSYNPTTADETLLFIEQNKFMYDVFTTILKTSMGRHYTRQHESTRDAQAVWSDYMQYMRTSSKADIELEDLMTGITSLRLTTTYLGTTENFIVEWLDKIKRYEDMTPLNSHFPDSMKKAMLQNAVSGIKEFQDVKTTDQMEVAKGNGPIHYPKYVTLLQNVAATYDKNHTPSKPRRLINVHDWEAYLLSENEYDAQDIEEDYFGSYLANETNTKSNFQRRRPSLRREVWNKLSKTDQMAWDQLSGFGKWAIISGTRKSILETDNNRGAQINLNEIIHEDDEQYVDAVEDIQDIDHKADHGTTLINAAASKSPLPAGDVRRLLSSTENMQLTPKSTPAKKKTQFKASLHELVRYRVSQHHGSFAKGVGSLIDRGANGGLAGNDVRIISKTDREVDVSGIDGHQMSNLPIVTAGGVVLTQRGEVIVIMNQFAYVPHGKSILSCIQLEHFGNKVDDRSIKLNMGSQTIKTLDGYVMPLNFLNGLAYMPMRPFTDNEWQSLPHVILTSDADWDPTVTDHVVTDDDTFFDCIADDNGEYDFTLFDHTGVPRAASVPLQANFVNRNDDASTSFDGTKPTRSPPVVIEANYHNTHIALIRHEISPECLAVHEQMTVPAKRNYHKYRDYFLKAPINVIQKTFDATTQFARSGWVTDHLYDTHRSPFPALNVKRRNEAVATDTIYCDTPAIDDGSTCAQFFTGISTKYCEAYGVKTDGQFIHTLLDVIRNRGAMDTLVSDRAKSELSNKVQDVLRHYCIDAWQSEPHHQHQNAAERRYKTVKHNINKVMNLVGAPAYCWLLCLQYVCFIMNRMALQSLHWRTPHEVLHGSTPDISMIYRFKFYDKVYFKRDESRGGENFPSASDEVLGRFVGFSENVGHSMTYKVLTDDTLKVLYRSRIKLASVDPNLRIDPLDNDTTGTNVNHINEDDSIDNDANDNDANDTVPHIIDEEQRRLMAIIDVDDMIGRSYLTPPDEDGTRRRIKIVEQLDQIERDLANDPTMIRFRATNDEGTVEEIITYNQIMQRLEAEDGDNDEWKFKAITNHQGPLSTSHPDYKGSQWNVQINWENGETTWEPLSIIAKSDPITCALYAKENDLLDQSGWIRFRRLANRQKKLLRLVHQAQLQSFRMRPVFKFGVQVPRNHDQAMMLDQQNGNTLWKEAEQRELAQIDEYETFKDMGVGVHPKGHKKIRVHMVYDVKPTLVRKARLVADGQLTETPIDSVYSSVVSLRGLKICLFIAELNQLEAWSTDVGNAYLEAYTQEKLYIVAGPEFHDRCGHTLLISRALYGLKSSGLRWWERFSEILLQMGFIPSKAEDDKWMRDKGSHYEYIARYVDDLAIISKNPQEIIKAFTDTYSLKLKGFGPIKYHLGRDFHRDSHNTLCMSPTKYITRMVDNYTRMFGSKPKTTYSSPLEKGDHPELDTSEELGIDDIKKYQSLIGALQWVITLGRFDIATAVMTLSSFRAAPRQGHLERAQRIYGYLYKMNSGTVRFRTIIPDYSIITVPNHDWTKSIYGDVDEIIPEDAPFPYGKKVVMTTYVDANLCHDMLTGRAVTGVLHFLNQTPIDYYTKKQPIVETATYGSEFMAARTATEQIMDLRTTLRYLGVRIYGPTYMFGDNKTVVNSSILPKARLHKRHVLLSFHRVREAIAAGLLYFIHIPGDLNPADILSKLWGYQQVKTKLKAILFYLGDTADIE